MRYRKFISIDERLPNINKIVDIYIKSENKILRRYMFHQEIKYGEDLVPSVISGDFVFVSIYDVERTLVNIVNRNNETSTVLKFSKIKLKDNLVTHWLY